MPRSLLVLMLVAMTLPVWGQNTEPIPRAKINTQTAAATDGSDQDDIAALKSDLQRMRTALYQMKTNLAFVGNTTTPLYHEFDLNIEMWQVMIDQMQRRVDRLERGHGTEPPREKK